jgi:site-specific recombinase XerD
MLEELERRNYAASTTHAYLRAVDEFARYFNRPPDQLGPDHIRQYQAYLFRERKFQPNTVIQHLGGIRFFYIRTLKQSWSADLTAPRLTGRANLSLEHCWRCWSATTSLE